MYTAQANWDTVSDDLASNGSVVNLYWSGRDVVVAYLSYCPGFAWRDWVKLREALMIVCVSAGVRSGHLSNTVIERFLLVHTVE
jgi:hypothetical protein